VLYRPSADSFAKRANHKPESKPVLSRLVTWNVALNTKKSCL
jgi:hypothetical protein